MRASSSLAVLACGLALALPARGADTSARERSRGAFRRGVTAAEHGDYSAARDAFVEAYRLYPHPSILLNVGIARWRTGELVEAEQDLAKFLADDGGASADEVSSARAAIVAVRDHLGTVHVSAQPGTARATLDGKAVALVPGGADVRAVVGRHTLAFEAEGYAPATREVNVERVQIIAVDVELAPLPSGAHVQTSTLAGGDSAHPIVGWTLVGVAVASAGVGTYCGVRALSMASAYNDPANASYQSQSTKSSGITLRTLSDVSFGGALVAAGVGAWLLLTGARADGAQASVVVGPGFAGMRGSF